MSTTTAVTAKVAKYAKCTTQTGTVGAMSPTCLRVLGFLAVLAFNVSFPSVAQAAALDKLKVFVTGTTSGRAEFRQTVVSKSGRKPQIAAGTMMFSRPGKFRWVYDKPYYQLIVGDGEKLWVYDRDLNQVSTRKLSAALGSTPAALLAGDNALEQNFVLSEGGAAEGIEWVVAQPRTADSGFESVRIGFAGDTLRAMELRDTLGAMTAIVFDKFERNPALSASLFRFTPPKGADVLGE